MTFSEYWEQLWIIVNTYVYPVSNGYVMIDTGYEHSLKSVARKLNRIGIELSEIKYVFLQTNDTDW